jgi:hypothetical protein
MIHVRNRDTSEDLDLKKKILQTQENHKKHNQIAKKLVIKTKILKTEEKRYYIDRNQE